MVKHKRIYLKSIGAGVQDIVFCEVCCNEGCDIHHIDEKGIGGRAGADELDNLVCLCRPCHDKAHRGEIAKAALHVIAKARIRHLRR